MPESPPNSVKNLISVEILAPEKLAGKFAKKVSQTMLEFGVLCRGYNFELVLVIFCVTEISTLLGFISLTNRVGAHFFNQQC